MVYLVVIIQYMILHSLQELKTILCRIQIYVIVLNGLLEPLYPDVIQCSTLSIHRDADILAFQILLL